MKRLIAILLVLLQGCLIIPTPPYRSSGRVFITPDMIDFIRTGSTSRAQVLLKLGEPDGVALNEKVFVYGWSVTKAWVAVGNGGGELTQSQYFLVAFNKDNTVRKTEIIKHDIATRKRSMISFINAWYYNDDASLIK
jgi:outer membrane protein assembly factor BamE (lipoprotein component of BamABCDE complex)